MANCQSLCVLLWDGVLLCTWLVCLKLVVILLNWPSQCWIRVLHQTAYGGSSFHRVYLLSYCQISPSLLWPWAVSRCPSHLRGLNISALTALWFWNNSQVHSDSGFSWNALASDVFCLLAWCHVGISRYISNQFNLADIPTVWFILQTFWSYACKQS